MSGLLDTLASPAEIRTWPLERLERLAAEVRGRIIDTVAANGGHLGGPLGVVELTIALHHVFDFPRDRLVWDVGHQAYAHKLLTGRAARFHTLRTEGGVSGYPAPDESPHDLFTTAHAGTAASLAAGLATGARLLHQQARSVAVVGDGALGCGVAYEALNHAAALKQPLLLVLNDNGMSIDRATGGLADFLRQVRSGTASAAGFFEAQGWSCIGPRDGHDLAGLIAVLQRLHDHPGPVVLHVHTQKGRGFSVDDPDPCGFHALTPCTVRQGRVTRTAARPARPSFTEVFGEALCRAGDDKPELIAITAAMPDGAGLVRFRQRFPQRCFDVGICEQHAVAFAAGAARAGLRPVAAIYSSFLQRAFDQVFHEVSLQNLPVVFALDRAGLVGADGPTHHGHADIAYFRMWPNLVVCAPADEPELHECLRFALRHQGPVAFRYPRDEAAAATARSTSPFELGRAVTLRRGTDVVLAAYGALVPEALRAADRLAEVGIDAGVINARFVKPLDEDTFADALAGHPLLVTLEDHFLSGGFGSAVLEVASELRGRMARVVRLGIPDRYLPHASRRRQLEWAGLTAEKITERVALEIEEGKGRREGSIRHPLYPLHIEYPTCLIRE